MDNPFVLQDKVPIIRMQAVLAVFRLQDKTDPECPVTKCMKIT